MSEQVPPVPEPSKPSGNWWQRKSRFKKILWSLAAVFVLLIIIAIAVPAEDDQDETATPTSPAAQEPETTEPETTEPAEPAPPPSSSNKATDENEPHVGRNGTVIVDTLTWRVLSVRQARELGGEFSKETPDGVYVVVKARVTNGKDESVTINSDIAQLEVTGSSYDTDSDGTSALQFGDDEEVFFLKDLGPNVATQGSFVFDVPRAALSQRMEICFGELGFGSTKGCIRLN